MSTVAAASSIATTLGIGSGLDISGLVTQLAAAQKAPQQQLITTRDTANKAQVSALAGITGGIDSFATALNTLISGGSLFTQPTSSNTAAIGVSAIAGGRIAGLSANLQVNQLAQGQTLTSAAVADAGAAIGEGGMTLVTANGTFHLTVGGTNDSLTGLAGAINAAGAGITANVLNDGGGSRLVLKGATGAGASFTLTADQGADPGLAAYTYDGGGGGLTKVQSAQDASMVLDGVTVTRGSNSLADVIPGVQLTLKATTTGPVAIGASVPTDAIAQAVSDFAASYNAFRATLDTDTASGLNGGTAGPFVGDPTIRAMVTKLGGLASTPLVTSGAVLSLADIGVSTGQDGKLSVDASRLNAVLAAHPDDVEALFNPTQSSSNPEVRITSPMGKVAPGSYALTGLVKGPPPSGQINGQDLIAAGPSASAQPHLAERLVGRPIGIVAQEGFLAGPVLAGRAGLAWRGAEDAVAAQELGFEGKSEPVEQAGDEIDTEGKQVFVEKDEEGLRRLPDLPQRDRVALVPFRDGRTIVVGGGPAVLGIVGARIPGSRHRRDIADDVEDRRPVEPLVEHAQLRVIARHLVADVLRVAIFPLQRLVDGGRPHVRVARLEREEALVGEEGGREPGLRLALHRQRLEPLHADCDARMEVQERVERGRARAADAAHEQEIRGRGLVRHDRSGLRQDPDAERLLDGGRDQGAQVRLALRLQLGRILPDPVRRHVGQAPTQGQAGIRPVAAAHRHRIGEEVDEPLGIVADHLMFGDLARSRAALRIVVHRILRERHQREDVAAR